MPRKPKSIVPEIRVEWIPVSCALPAEGSRVEVMTVGGWAEEVVWTGLTWIRCKDEVEVRVRKWRYVQ